MVLMYFSITALSVAVIALAVSLHRTKHHVQVLVDSTNMLVSSTKNALGIAMAVQLNAQMDEVDKMRRKAQRLIREEQYEEAEALKEKILRKSREVQEAVDAYNRHSADLRIGLNDNS